MAPSTHKVTLTPKAGFVIKTTCTAIGTYTTLLGSGPISQLNSGPTEVPTTISVHKGFKVFLNVCWDSNVPAPPERTEDQIRRAMMGADFDEGVYFVPVVVSDGRPVTDKAGKPSLVFDCVFNMTLRGRSNKEFEFRTFLTEIALERVEDKSGLTLSRELATPNISSKGPLEPRTVSIPTSLILPPIQPSLIQEVTSTSSTAASNLPAKSSGSSEGATQPVWTSEVESTGIKVTVEVPNLTKSLFSSNSTTLDVEAHRIIFVAHGLYALDLRVGAQGKFTAVPGKIEENSPTGVTGRGLRPDSATAEWRTAEKRIIIQAKWD